MIAWQRWTFMVALKTLMFSILVPGTITVIIPYPLLRAVRGLVLPVPSLWMIGLLPLVLGVGDLSPI
jgi:hypothetical protein